MAVYEFEYTYRTRGVAVMEFDSDEEANEWLDHYGEDTLYDIGHDIEFVEVEYDVDIREQLEDGRTRIVWV